MERERMKEEYLEALWHMMEDGKTAFAAFREELGEPFHQDIVDELTAAGIVTLRGEEVALSEQGRSHTRQLIRSHRLAERLVHDALGVEDERGACEFEHVINPALVDSICTLLGHPRECPHGMPIPEGECCRRQAQVVESSVLPLTRLKVGEAARIAYVHARGDPQMHKLDSLLIRPGAEVKLHQRYPSFVIECENAVVALDDEVAAGIHVWVCPQRGRPGPPHGGRRPGWGFRHGEPPGGPPGGSPGRGGGPSA
jgi:DtxR family Mn-dependent transcriptional regulator